MVSKSLFHTSLIIAFVGLILITIFKRIDQKPEVKTSLVEYLSPLGEKSRFQFRELKKGVLAQSGDLILRENEFKEDPYLKDLKARLEQVKVKLKSGELNPESYQLAAAASSVFRHKLKLISTDFQNRAIEAEAKKIGVTTAVYFQKYIFPKSRELVSEQSVEKYLSLHPPPSGVEEKKWAQKKIIQRNKKLSEKYFSEKFLLDLPIEVSLKPPNFKVQVGLDHVPSLGPKDSELQIHLFADSKSLSSKSAIKSMLKFSKRLNGAYFGFHPLFQKSDVFQVLRHRIGFCLWGTHPEIYFPFLEASLGQHGEETEKVLFQSMDSLGVSIPLVKKCVFEQRYKEVVDYHSEYNEDFLAMAAGPVMIINGEVLVGQITDRAIDDVICRKLGLACAARWVY